MRYIKSSMSLPALLGLVLLILLGKLWAAEDIGVKLVPE